MKKEIHEKIIFIINEFKKLKRKLTQEMITQKKIALSNPFIFLQKNDQCN